MVRRFFAVALLGLAGMALPGCPFFVVPFDTTGTYTGTFTIGAQGVDVLSGCTITLELEQNAGGILLSNAVVNGVVSLDFSCIVGEDLAGLLGLLNDELFNTGDVEISGFLLPNGLLELNTPDLLAECPVTDCVKIALLGEGVDEDEDGAMDTLSGSWGGALQVGNTVVPVFGQFNVEIDE